MLFRSLIICLSLCPQSGFVTEENLNKYHLLAKNLGAGFIRILEPRKAGRFSSMDVLLDDQQISIIIQFMLSRNKDPYYSTYPIIQFPGHHQRKSGCLGAGTRYIYIDSNGYFHACPFCRNPLGNVREDSIETASSRARAAGCHAFKQREIF